MRGPTFDDLAAEVDERARKAALLQFAREAGIPMSLTPTEGIRWYLREFLGADEAHVERIHVKIRTHAIATTVDGIKADLAQAFYQTREQGN